jgi:hypothetical protein
MELEKREREKSRNRSKREIEAVWPIIIVNAKVESVRRITNRFPKAAKGFFSFILVVEKFLVACMRVKKKRLLKEIFEEND